MTEAKKVARVLIVDDEKDVLKSLADTLTLENFDVKTAARALEGLKTAREWKPDLILLDLRLPDLDGYDVCRQLKADAGTADIPIIMVSTRSKDTEKVVGLEMGADDYLTKPYSPMELLARVRVALRRKTASKPPAADVLMSGPVMLSVNARTVKVNGKSVDLTRKEFDLLALLLSKPDHVFNRVTLLESVWGYSITSLQATVDTHIKTLRKKLGAGGGFVQTVTGVGYRWAEPIIP